MIKTKGIVVGVNKVGENDKLLSVFTEDLGLIGVSAKGATSKHNNLKAISDIFCFSEFVFYEPKNGYYTISEANPIADFIGIAKDYDRLEAGTGLLKFIRFTAVENEESGETLKLLLNSLHILANTDKSISLVKCVFYLKCLENMGLPPVTDECAVCGSGENTEYFSAEEGGILCAECARNSENKVHISAVCRKLMHFIKVMPLTSAFGIETDEKIFEEVLGVLKIFINTHIGTEI